MVELDRVFFFGHPNILGTHRNTIEVTLDEQISRRADCIIGVRASKGCSDVTPQLRRWIREGKPLEFEIRAKSLSFVFSGRGDGGLDLKDERELVLRRSDYLSSRTLAVRCSKAACDVPRKMIRELQDPQTRGLLIISSARVVEGEDSFNWTLP